MKTGKSAIFLGPIVLVLLLFMPGTLLGQEEPSDCVVGGALAYDNWTKVDSGGTGSLPEGAEDSDYIRCKACHGWDHMATDGGYVRRSRNEGRPNAGAGDGDQTSRNISFAGRGEGEMVTADMIWHSGTGRSYADGKGSWVALEDTHSSGNKAAHSNGYTLGNQHPDFSAGGMTTIQADCLAEFLNYEDADPTAYFNNINPDINPVLYTIVNTADAAAIAGTLISTLNDKSPHALILTGGTGISPRDVTIEAVKPYLKKELTAFGAIFAQLSFEEIDSAALLSRAAAGIIGTTAVFCIPGSLKACKLACKALIFPELGHLTTHIQES